MYQNHRLYQQHIQDPCSDHFRLLQPFLLNFLKEHKPLSIVDIGCGTGSLLEVIGKAKAPEILAYWGIDTSDDALEICQQKFGHHPGYNFLKPETFLASQKAFDLGIFCLSLWEMQDEIIRQYLQKLDAKELLII